MSWNSSIRVNIKQAISVCTVVMLAITMVILISILTESSAASLESPTALNEIIPDSENENVDNNSLNSINTLSISDKATEIMTNIDDGTVALARAAEPAVENETIAEDDIAAKGLTGTDPYQLIASDIENIKNKDQATIERYFGTSSAFNIDIVADKLAATTVTFISSEVVEDISKTPNEQENKDTKDIQENQASQTGQVGQDIKVVIHICTLDYNKMLQYKKQFKEGQLEKGEVEEKINEQVTKALAKGVVNGDFDTHYTIPVMIKDNSVVITEEFKQAITGGWYAGMNTQLQSVACPLESATKGNK